MQLTPEDKAYKNYADKKRQDDFAKAKKRTCPKCGIVFLTRKDKRIHRKSVHLLIS